MKGNSMNINRIKSMYPSGTRVECIEMKDAQAVPTGTLGTVNFVDDMGTVHVDWDNGSTLGLITGEDSFKIYQTHELDYEVIPVNITVNTPVVAKQRLEPKINQIKTAVKVPHLEYLRLLDDPLENRNYIKDHIEDMYFEDDVYHSILVYCEEEQGGILIESEGYEYARYQGFVSNVHEILETGIVDLEDDTLHKKIKVLVVEPENKPYVAVIDNSLESTQSMVGGYIETLYLSNSAEIICNEEGKIMNLQANRRIGNDVIAGRFIIVGVDGGEHFKSLSEEDIKKYSQRFNDIEMIDQREVQDLLNYDIKF